MWLPRATETNLAATGVRGNLFGCHGLGEIYLAARGHGKLIWLPGWVGEIYLVARGARGNLFGCQGVGASKIEFGALQNAS